MYVLQKILGEQPVGLSGATSTRWRCYEKAVRNVRPIYASLVTSLEKEASERGCGKVRGYVAQLKRWRTPVIIEILHLILPSLSTLSKIFQVGWHDQTRIQFPNWGSLPTLSRSTHIVFHVVYNAYVMVEKVIQLAIEFSNLRIWTFQTFNFMPGICGPIWVDWDIHWD